MRCKFIKTKIQDLYIVKREKYFDSRGYITEILNSKLFLKKNFQIKNSIISKSNKNVLRGFHYQKKTYQSTCNMHKRRNFRCGSRCS